MEAARILTERGHEVVLYEKENKLGGKLPAASALVYMMGSAAILNMLLEKRWLAAQESSWEGG
jgi:NADPH-dependent 2,4-dienoyl-CoA reductase/sulfur reductase-like enzyme